MSARELEAQKLQKDWDSNPRWAGIKRGYSAADVIKLRGSVAIEHTLAKRGAEKLWSLLHDEPFVNALGALTGNQAMQQVKAGLKAIYLSGWQVAETPISRAKCIPTSRSIQPTRCRWWSSASITPFQRADQSNGQRARTTSTISRPSWRTPKPASAAC